MDATDNNVNHQQDLASEYENLQGLGDCCASVEDYARAKLYYERAANLAPDEPGPYVGLGVVALQEDRIDDAEIAFRVACRLDTACARAYAGLGMVAQQRTDYKQAFEMYLKCLERDQDNMIALLGLFQASCERGSFSEVIHYLEVYLDMHPGDTSVMFPLAALYMKDGRFDDSRKTLLELLTLDPSHEDAANLLEELDYNVARTTQGIEAATQRADRPAARITV